MCDEDSRDTATGDVLPTPTVKVVVSMSTAVQITACITAGLVILGAIAIVCFTRSEAIYDKQRGAVIRPHDDPAPRVEVTSFPLPAPTPAPRAPALAKKDRLPLKMCPEGGATPSGAMPSR